MEKVIATTAVTVKKVFLKFISYLESAMQMSINAMYILDFITLSKENLNNYILLQTQTHIILETIA